ncbi:hypothetical protein DFH29DRAFT_1003238 [Suillus ampliporus]|nr:hypothetical protein DFH29DRAFT_1003238 [Suillus ampliporus]
MGAVGLVGVVIQTAQPRPTSYLLRRPDHALESIFGAKGSQVIVSVLLDVCTLPALLHGPPVFTGESEVGKEWQDRALERLKEMGLINDAKPVDLEK